MSAPLLQEGLQLMLVGMGTVFVFLTLLVLATSAMSALVQRWWPPLAADLPAGEPSDEEVAAIAAAITLHRNQTQDPVGRPG